MRYEPSSLRAIQIDKRQTGDTWYSRQSPFFGRWEYCSQSRISDEHFRNVIDRWNGVNLVLIIPLWYILHIWPLIRCASARTIFSANVFGKPDHRAFSFLFGDDDRRVALCSFIWNFVFSFTVRLSHWSDRVAFDKIVCSHQIVIVPFSGILWISL